MKRIFIILILVLITIPVFLFVLYNISLVNRNIKTHYCIKNKYVIFYNNNESTTLSRKEKDGNTGVIRGKIEKFYTKKEYLIGYLSVTNSSFAQDELMGYEKDGYFIFNLNNEKYQFGLSEALYTSKVDKLLDINSSLIKYKSLPSYSFSCFFN